MPKASVKRLIECDKNQLIDLVLDIEKYPIFVPYCLNSKIHEKNEDGDLIIIKADLTIGKGPIKDTYKSDVQYNKKNNSIYVTNIDGPLKYLDNKWYFKDHECGTEVIFDINFQLKNKFLNIIMTKFFQHGINTIADAFQERANKLFNNI